MNKLDSSELRSLCIKNEWFTAGTCDQYDKLFDANENGASVDALALMIWMCSGETTIEAITAELNEATAWPIWVETLAQNLKRAEYGEIEISIICEAVRTHPEAGNAYKVIEQ